MFILPTVQGSSHLGKGVPAVIQCFASTPAATIRGCLQLCFSFSQHLIDLQVVSLGKEHGIL